MEDHADQAQPRVHVQQAEADARSDQRVQRTADAQLGRRAGPVGRTPGRERRSRQVFHRRDRQVRVRAPDKRDRRREIGVPQIRQVRIRAIHLDTGPGTGLDDLANGNKGVEDQ